MKEEVASAMMAAEAPSPYAKGSSRASPAPTSPQLTQPQTQKNNFKYKFASHQPHPTKGVHVSLFDGLSFETPSEPVPPSGPSASASVSQPEASASGAPLEPAGSFRYIIKTRPVPCYYQPVLCGKRSYHDRPSWTRRGTRTGRIKQGLMLRTTAMAFENTLLYLANRTASLCRVQRARAVGRGHVLRSYGCGHGDTSRT
eukprot:121966-Prorocentrum_minimum.AAC.1